MCFLFSFWRIRFNISQYLAKVFQNRANKVLTTVKKNLFEREVVQFGVLISSRNSSSANRRDF